MTERVIFHAKRCSDYYINLDGTPVFTDDAYKLIVLERDQKRLSELKLELNNIINERKI